METMDYEDFKQSFDLEDIDDDLFEDFFGEGVCSHFEVDEDLKGTLLEDEDFKEFACEHYYELYLVDQRPCFG